MSDDRRQAAVDQVSRMLEDDRISLDEYQSLVDRILATTTEGALVAIVESLPIARPMVIECASGVVKEAPAHLDPITELRLGSGVLKLDLRNVELDTDVDLEIDVDTGVLLVIIPRHIAVEVGEHRSDGGAFKNAVKHRPAAAGEPRLVVHVRNGGGVIKLRHPRRWWFG